MSKDEALDYKPDNIQGSRMEKAKNISFIHQYIIHAIYKLYISYLDAFISWGSPPARIIPGISH